MSDTMTARMKYAVRDKDGNLMQLYDTPDAAQSGADSRTDMARTNPWYARRAPFSVGESAPVVVGLLSVPPLSLSARVSREPPHRDSAHRRHGHQDDARRTHRGVPSRRSARTLVPRRSRLWRGRIRLARPAPRR